MCCFGEVAVKYTFIISNILFALLGVAILGVGAAAHSQLQNLPLAFTANLNYLTICVIVIGCVIFLTSFAACWGAIKESQVLLAIYSIFLGILAAAKVFITVNTFIFLATASFTVSIWLQSEFTSWIFPRPDFNIMEAHFQCCGTNGATSYNNIGRQIPPTCCYNPNMLADQCTLANSYGGCNMIVSDVIETFGTAIAALLIVLFVVEIVCIVFGSILVFRIRSKRYNS